MQVVSQRVQAWSLYLDINVQEWDYSQIAHGFETYIVRNTFSVTNGRDALFILRLRA